MGFTTLRFTRAGHEIDCRYFLTHLMNIGSPTLRFRDAATRRQAIPRNGSYAIGTPCTRKYSRSETAGAGTSVAGGKQISPGPVPSLLLLPLSCRNPLCLTETYDPARRPSLRPREGAAAEDQDRGDGGDRSRSCRPGVDVPQLARGASRRQVLHRPPASGLRNRLWYLFQRSRLAKASAEIFSVPIRGLLSRLGTGRRVGSRQVPPDLRIGQHE